MSASARASARARARASSSPAILGHNHLAIYVYVPSSATTTLPSAGRSAAMAEALLIIVSHPSTNSATSQAGSAATSRSVARIF